MELTVTITHDQWLDIVDAISWAGVGMDDLTDMKAQAQASYAKAMIAVRAAKPAFTAVPAFRRQALANGAV